MFTGQYERKAVTLAGVLAVALIGVSAVGLWAGAVGPASTDAALVDPALVMDVDAGISIGDPLEDLASVTPPDAPNIKECANICSSPGQGCARLSCEPCCWLCGGHVICILPPPPGP